MRLRYCKSHDIRQADVTVTSPEADHDGRCPVPGAARLSRNIRRRGRSKRNSARAEKMGGFNFYLAIPREKRRDEGRREGGGGHLTLLPLPQLPPSRPWPPPAGATRLATKNTRRQSFLARAHSLTQTLLTPSLPAGLRTPRSHTAARRTLHNGPLYLRHHKDTSHSPGSHPTAPITFLATHNTQGHSLAQYTKLYHSSKHPTWQLGPTRV
ncbi:hypothetical protein E2C01_010435 [Portunus trituberculatus]|uniref:Uncharacterized protein n=1 Tax=Portunus trituberculatus TaxID=210409 RepID=A0A5B7D8N4_PORTR|nr:hypothetical protein [Portunus trituberculatus]